MPRERNFSEPDVLDLLADVFSSNGYAGTSMARLQEATGLGKQSLYNSFGDKQSMYLQAIDCAIQRFVLRMGPLQAAANGRAAVWHYFDTLINSCASSDPAQKHCIVTSGLLEGADVPPVHWALSQHWQATHEMLRVAVERGQHDGSINNQAPSADLAEMLMTLTSGLRVAARVGRSRAQMERLVAITLGVLDMA